MTAELRTNSYSENYINILVSCRVIDVNDYKTVMRIIGQYELINLLLEASEQLSRERPAQFSEGSENGNKIGYPYLDNRQYEVVEHKGMRSDARLFPVGPHNEYELVAELINIVLCETTSN